MSSKSHTILAIDPGYDRCGAAVIKSDTAISVLHSWCITTDKKQSLAERYAYIFRTLEEAIAHYAPTAIAVETLFFSVNKKSAMAVAEARGMIVLLAGLHNIPLIELSPQEVKLGVTGSGNADKAAVQKMVQLTLKIDPAKKLDDEIDAIAVGVAAAGTLKLKQYV